MNKTYERMAGLMLEAGYGRTMRQGDWRGTEKFIKKSQERQKRLHQLPGEEAHRGVIKRRLLKSPKRTQRPRSLDIEANIQDVLKKHGGEGHTGRRAGARDFAQAVNPPSRLAKQYRHEDAERHAGIKRFLARLDQEPQY